MSRFAVSLARLYVPLPGSLLPFIFYPRPVCGTLRLFKRGEDTFRGLKGNVRSFRHERETRQTDRAGRTEQRDSIEMVIESSGTVETDVLGR